MLRVMVVVLSVLGAAFMVGMLFPSTLHVAFRIANIGITWLMLIAGAVGFIAIKSTG